MATASAMFSSVMDMFKPKPATGPGDGDPNKNNLVPNDTTIKPDGTGPTAIPAAGDGDKSPLDGYKELWQTAETDAKPLQLTPSLKTDPAKLVEAAKGVDFTKGMNTELLAAAGKGDTAALGQLINEAAQQGYAQSALATTKIVEAALNEQAKMFQATIMPEILRRNNVGLKLREDNPIFSNPAVAPILKGLEAQLMVKHKNATPEEISQHAKNIFSGMAEEFVKSSGKKIVDAGDTTQPGVGGGSQAESFDWEKHFLGETPGR